MRAHRAMPKRGNASFRNRRTGNNLSSDLLHLTFFLGTGGGSKANSCAERLPPPIPEESVTVHLQPGRWGSEKENSFQGGTDKEIRKTRGKGKGKMFWARKPSRSLEGFFFSFISRRESPYFSRVIFLSSFRGGGGSKKIKTGLELMSLLSFSCVIQDEISHRSS